MPLQITINPYLIHYENKTNTVKSLHHVKISLFFLICSFHSYVIKAKMYAISSDTHQLQFLKLHHFKLEGI